MAEAGILYPAKALAKPNDAVLYQYLQPTIVLSFRKDTLSKSLERPRYAAPSLAMHPDLLIQFWRFKTSRGLGDS